MSSEIEAAYEATLRQLGSRLTHEDLLRQYPPPPQEVKQHGPVVPSLRQCKFFELFDADPRDVNRHMDEVRRQAEATHGRAYMQKILLSEKHHELKKSRKYDFRLTEAERRRLKKLGVAVSERLGAESFAKIYYQLYTDDMPVYITADSVLHAWHRSFDAFLAELEEKEMAPLLCEVLTETSVQCQHAYMKAKSDAMRRVLLDVDAFLSVALSLFKGNGVSNEPRPEKPGVWAAFRFTKQPSLEPMSVSTVSSLEPNASRVETILSHVDKQRAGSVQLFSGDPEPRDIDFSLFRPRGHYTKSQQLQQYFRTVSWLGTIDFRFDGAHVYQLQCACLLVHLMRVGNVIERLRVLHTAVDAIAGDGFGSDSMTPLELHDLIGNREILKLVADADALRQLQSEIDARGLGAQAITGHPYVENEATPTTPTRLPTSFAFMGAQFVWSAFIFSKTVFDQVVYKQTKVVRRLPSAVDAAFALFGNEAASGEAARRMMLSENRDKDFVRFRDGLPYASNLMALRRVVDERFDKPTHTFSIPMLWQQALRELSRSSPNPDAVFHSDAWHRRLMNTQVASLTQLRHDTVLYAKQGATMFSMCEYPAGFVDPYPSFWGSMQQLAQRMTHVVSALHSANPSNTYAEFQAWAGGFFENFSSVMGMLKGIATKQAQREPLTQAQDNFLKRVMEERHGSGGSRYLGWYPGLFFTDRVDSGMPDRLVADVHTDGPSPEHQDPGGILHLGVGNVNLGFFVVNNAMYAGPVFSSYEFVTKPSERLTDSEFEARLLRRQYNAPPWARDSFLVE